MTIITYEIVTNTIVEEWKRAVLICEDKGISPAHPLCKVAVKKMSCLGKASNQGVITITSTLIGTDKHDVLVETLRHEIAHLIAGISAGHGKKWKMVCKLIGGEPKRCASADTELLEKTFKYKLMAVLSDGKEVLAGYRNKRSKKFLEPKNVYSINGKTVSRFYYQEVA